jgi:hypothetical protein
LRYRIELPQHNGAGAVRRFVENWLDQPALRRIVELEDGRWPQGSALERATALHDFSARWDFRGGAERLELRGSASGDEAEILAAAHELGLAAADPPTTTQYDHGLVLGGTALASIYRLRRLFEFRGSAAEIRHPAVLTALRTIDEKELRLVRDREEIAALAEDVSTEFDVMTKTVARFSGSAPEVERRPHENPNLSSASAVVGDTIVLAAPSADPGRRANTRDNYDVYSKRIGPADSVLLVTSSIYLPYQFFIALQALGWDQPRAIEAVGFPPEWMQGVLTGVTNVLQELRSALFGAVNTLKQLDGP